MTELERFDLALVRPSVPGMKPMDPDKPWSKGDWVRHSDALAAIERERERAERAVAEFYPTNRAACARLCDEHLDPSGALLGRVRELVRSDPNEPQSSETTVNDSKRVPLPELWRELLDEGENWSAEKIKRFVDAARDLRDVQAKSNDDFESEEQGG
jgi:hypothetical protein